MQDTIICNLPHSGSTLFKFHMSTSDAFRDLREAARGRRHRVTPGSVEGAGLGGSGRPLRVIARKCSPCEVSLTGVPDAQLAGPLRTRWGRWRYERGAAPARIPPTAQARRSVCWTTASHRGAPPERNRGSDSERRKRRSMPSMPNPCRGGWQNASGRQVNWGDWSQVPAGRLPRSP